MKKTTVLGSLFSFRILLLTRFLYGLIPQPGDSMWDYFTVKETEGGSGGHLVRPPFRGGLPPSQLLF